MVKLGKREKMLASVFGAFIFLFLMQKVVFLPFLERAEIMDTEIKASEQKLKRALYMNTQKASVAEIFDRIKPYIGIGKTEEDILSSIMKEIEEIAKDSKVALLNMKPDASGEEHELGYKTKKVSISIEGSQHDVVKFLYKLEDSNYPLSITRVDLKIKDRDIGLMEADFDVHFIYFL